MCSCLGAPPSVRTFLQHPELAVFLWMSRLWTSVASGHVRGCVNRGRPFVRSSESVLAALTPQGSSGGAERAGAWPNCACTRSTDRLPQQCCIHVDGGRVAHTRTPPLPRTLVRSNKTTQRLGRLALCGSVRAVSLDAGGHHDHLCPAAPAVPLEFLAMVGQAAPAML